MSPCIVWEGGKTKAGYGQAYVNGQRMYAHRLAYERARGPIPKGRIVMHACDNPPCINPEHLRLGTDADNVRDMWSKGRAVPPPVHYGENNPSARLTTEQARAIKRDRRILREVAADYGVSIPCIHAIRTGRTWKNA